LTEKVALKILDKSKMNNRVDKMIIREIILQQKLDHSNIIKIYEVMETLSKIYIVMEYAKFGELFQRVNSYGKLDEDQAKVVFLQIVSAVEYLVSWLDSIDN
jgi:PREDICTED: MAP/microtubule affinity-regulating kinase 2-like